VRRSGVWAINVMGRVSTIDASNGFAKRMNSGDGGQATGDRRQATGDRRQATNDRRQSARLSARDDHRSDSPYARAVYTIPDSRFPTSGAVAKPGPRN